MTDLALILEPEQLAAALSREDIRIIDLCKPEQYASGHIAGAVHLDYMQIIHNEKPVFGLLPDEAGLSALLSQCGISPDTHVIAYDDEGGGKAGRFLWTLEVAGHRQYSLLNGGIVAWANEGHPLVKDIPRIEAGNYPVHYQEQACCDRAYVQTHLQDPACALLDCRSPEEFSGQVTRAGRGGHIPGAVNMDWMLVKDQSRNLRLIEDRRLQELLKERNISDQQEVILYCHSHHRSALVFLALKHLGFSRLKGYPGSWSDWAHAADTPVAC